VSAAPDHSALTLQAKRVYTGSAHHTKCSHLINTFAVGKWVTWRVISHEKMEAHPKKQKQKGKRNHHAMHAYWHVATYPWMNVLTIPCRCPSYNGITIAVFIYSVRRKIFACQYGSCCYCMHSHIMIDTLWQIIVLLLYALLQRRVNKWKEYLHGFFGIPVWVVAII